ncbi:MAG: hypothetical protein IT427_07695 [Pirellulales bacterium]|nr:hypothetical protein [Pirellulales bacterium]
MSEKALPKANYLADVHGTKAISPNGIPFGSFSVAYQGPHRLNAAIRV